MPSYWLIDIIYFAIPDKVNRHNITIYTVNKPIWNILIYICVKQYRWYKLILHNTYISGNDSDKKWSHKSIRMASHSFKESNNFTIPALTLGWPLDVSPTPLKFTANVSVMIMQSTFPYVLFDFTSGRPLVTLWCTTDQEPLTNLWWGHAL